jgi:hypothetical protein
MTNNGTGFIVKDIVLTEIHTEGKVIGGGLKEGKFILSMEAAIGELTCKYATAGSPLHYVPGTDVLTMTEAKLTPSPVACGTSTTLDGSFTVKTDVETLTPLTLD